MNELQRRFRSSVRDRVVPESTERYAVLIMSDQLFDQIYAALDPAEAKALARVTKHAVERLQAAENVEVGGLLTEAEIELMRSERKHIVDQLDVAVRRAKIDEAVSEVFGE